MPQEYVGCASARRPTLVLLLGVAMTLMAHLVACGVHATEDHRPAVTASTERGQHGVDALPLAAADLACSATDAGDGNPDHDVLCCGPAHVLAYLPAPIGAMLLALLLLVLLPLRHRSQEATASGTPPGPEETPEARRILTGSSLLRIVCVSRT
ncbi:hypothetical protein OHT57_17175 [Streptomyces sp. NBC_00285]|uniref:hypothetical protein n=1 Tax=Streptomyces sp. NBC_00285 TaxID=2975700 RepID=UPI002E2CEA29|nr:hypothetical protein [Streptomyces sp. NBC_00285]